MGFLVPNVLVSLVLQKSLHYTIRGFFNFIDLILAWMVPLILYLKLFTGNSARIFW